MLKLLTHWNTLLSTECLVLRLEDRYIFPIFKNGSTSLHHDSDEILTNDEISGCNLIHILLRDPRERFQAGINKYAMLNNTTVKNVIQQVKKNELSDRHFMPQWVWLLHLYKYYHGNVQLDSFKNIANYCKNHKGKTVSYTQETGVLADYIDYDYQLISHIGKTLPLKKLIEGCNHALS